jgi:SPIRAL1-like protein
MTSSNAFADGATQNAGNVLTDRRTTRGVKPPGGGSSLAFGREETGEDDRGRATTGSEGAREGKTREMVGNHQNHLSTREDEDAPTTTRTTTTTTTTMRKMTGDDVRGMMLKDLRTFCRRHGLNPAGSREALMERAREAIEGGACEDVVEDRGASGTVTTREGGERGNNYGRSSGQNVGNFLTERKTSRVLREPGGGSSFVFGGESPPRAGSSAGNDEGTRSRGESPGSRAQRAAIAAIAGSDIFACPKPRVSKISDAKLAEFRGHDVFDQSLPERKPLAGHRQAAVKHIQGANIFANDAPARRRARRGSEQAPGGSSSINFEAFFLPASDDEGGADADADADAEHRAAEDAADDAEHHTADNAADDGPVVEEPDE